MLSLGRSFVVDLGGAWTPGQPTRSLYHFELLIAVCREIGLAHEANSVLSLLALASDGGVLKRDTTVLDNTLRGDPGHGFLFDRISR